MTLVVGVDAHPRGWVAVALADGVSNVAASAHLDVLLSRFSAATVIALDMPIGLPTVVRDCDLQARAFIGPRRNSVFMTPSADLLFAATYEEANRRARALSKMGISRQAYALGRNVRVVNELAEHDRRLIEVHPEVSFRALVGEDLDYPKSSWNGQIIRRMALSRAGVGLPDVLEEAGAVPPTDIIDAAAAAWSARRFASGKAESLPPDSSPTDRQVIWF